MQQHRINGLFINSIEPIIYHYQLSLHRFYAIIHLQVFDVNTYV